MRIIRFLFTAILVLSTTGSIHAQTEGILNKLLAPGPLIEAHHQLEGSDCLKCHASGKGIPDGKCLDCHKEIKKFVDDRKGFHGKLDESCIQCHRDHKGRSFESMTINENSFDHQKTGFSLEGKHEKIKCSECHLDKRGVKSARPGEIRYFGKTSSCASCHKKEDIHFYKGEWSKKDCNTCHGVRTWKDDIKFSHKRDTGYELTGAHEDLKCNKCHKPNEKTRTAVYQWPHLKANQCLSCHDNFHKTTLSHRFTGKNGGECTKCHTQDDWKIASFNHTVVNFPLRGKHATINCNKCHVQSTKTAKLESKNYVWHGLEKKTACASCHSDYHAFGKFESKRLGILQKCQSCHSEESWQQTKNFDHNRQTRYAIDGKHADLKCNECHVPRSTELQKTNTKPVGKYFWKDLTTKTCESCHKSPHIGVFSQKMLAEKCTKCHVTDGWKQSKSQKNFNHSQTRFELTGKHKSISCNECHLIDKKQVYKFASFEKQFCIDCHKNQHLKQFSPKFANQSCNECHTTEKFEKLKPFNHDVTQYKLRDAHAKLNCTECHVSTSEKFETKSAHIKHQFLFPELGKKACVTCHTDYHRGQLTMDCAKCHSEKTWKKPKFDHNSDSQFALKGKHQDLKCDQCHRPLRGQFVKFAGQNFQVTRYKPLSSKCSDCHSDYHGGQLDNNCAKCHFEKSWKETKFNHDTDSRFPIKGKHEELACNKCHVKMSGQSVKFAEKTFPLIRYKPINPNCIECHKDPHQGSLGKRCTSCHNENDWKKISDFHRGFTLHGVHYAISCNECHRDSRHLGGLSDQCFICHQKDDVHSGALPQCGECHLQQAWEHTKFKHSMTFFPLRGVHRTLQCNECHRNGIYRGTPNQCIDCHRSDAAAVSNPTHVMPNFTNCKSCHNQFSF